MRAGDQARHIGQNKHLVVAWGFGDAQVRAERGERVVTDTRPRRAGHRQQARFAGVWLADQRRLRNGFQLELERTLFAWFATLRDSWGALRTGGKVRVAESATTTAGNHDAVARANEIGCHPVVGLDAGARRHQKDQVFAGFAMLAGASAMPATLGLEVPFPGEVQEG